MDLSTRGKLFFSVTWHPVEGKPGEKRRQMIAEAGGVIQLIGMLQATPIKDTAKRMMDLVADVVGLQQTPVQQNLLNGAMPPMNRSATMNKGALLADAAGTPATAPHVRRSAFP